MSKSLKKLELSLENYFSSNGWNYEFDRENSVFRITLALNGKIKSVNHVIYVGDSEYRSYAYPNIMNANEKSYNSVAEYLHRINRSIFDGRFEIDFEDGEIRFFIRKECINREPEEKDFLDILELPEYIISCYGEGLLAVMFGVKSPKEAAKEALDNLLQRNV